MRDVSRVDDNVYYDGEDHDVDGEVPLLMDAALSYFPEVKAARRQFWRKQIPEISLSLIWCGLTILVQQ